MNVYAVNKIQSLSLALGTMFLLYLILQVPQQTFWRIITMLAIAIGNWHIFTGTIYRIRNKIKKEKTLKPKNSTFLLLVLIICLTLFYIRYVGELLALTVIIFTLYFYYHTIANEKILLEKSTKRIFSFYLLYAMIFLVFAIIVDSIESLSFLMLIMDKGWFLVGEFLLYNSFISYENILNVPYKEAIITTLILISTFLTIAGFVKKEFKKKTTIVMILAILLSISFMILFPPIEIIYLIVFALIYHASTWFIFYQDNKKVRKQLFKDTIVIVLLFAIIIILAHLFSERIFTLLYELFFAVKYALLWAFIHITLSFDNDAFVRKILKLK